MEMKIVEEEEEYWMPLAVKSSQYTTCTYMNFAFTFSYSFTLMQERSYIEVMDGYERIICKFLLVFIRKFKMVFNDGIRKFKFNGFVSFKFLTIL